MSTATNFRHGKKRRIIKTSDYRSLPEVRFSYVDLHPSVGNFFIPEMLPARLTQLHPKNSARIRTPPLSPPSPYETRRSCVDRLCSGICNFFNRGKRSDENNYDERHYNNSSSKNFNHRLPRLIYSSNSTSNPKSHPRRSKSRAAYDEETLEDSDDNDNFVTLNTTPIQQYPALDYHTRYTEESEGAEEDDDCGEYIIYLPKVSRTLLERTYLEPLRNANFDPVVIQPPALPNTKGNPKRGIILNKADSLPPSGNRSQVSSNSKPKSSHREQSEEMLMECLSRVGKLINDSTKAYGDQADESEEIDVDVDKAEEKSEAKNYLYIYIPTSDSSSAKEFSFQIHEKKINWAAIHERHCQVELNQQYLLQRRLEKWQIYFSVWDRRRLIADMKKKLAGDISSVACSPPNMLESRFHHIHWLGNSTRSNNTVGRYFDKEENAVVALKIFGSKPSDTLLENLDSKLKAMQEIISLRRLDHKNVVRLLGYFELKDKFHLILESCDHSLRNDIEEAPSGLGTLPSKKIVFRILNGLNFCHEMECLHRDLCPENILICKNGEVKIADFDRSVFLIENGVGKISPTPGSYVYNSPEILAGDKEYGFPSDVWSLGIIFCEMLTGRSPWLGRNAPSQLREIHNSVGPLLPRHASVAKVIQMEVMKTDSDSLHNHAQLQQMFTTISAPCCSFIKKCLDVNPLNRYTCAQLLQHPFIKGNYK